MQLMSKNFSNAEKIPGNLAFAVPAKEDHIKLSANRNPELHWNEVPAGTKSLALICADPDVPSQPDDVNQEGRSVPKDLPRVTFYHWVMIDIPAGLTHIEEGSCSDGVTERGKKNPPGPQGSRQGINDYTGWFSGDPDMAGDYYGYDGPCPPWNDELLHRYEFTLYALDIERCPVNERFSAQEVLQAIEGHILDKATLTGVYTLNPAVSI